VLEAKAAASQFLRAVRGKRSQVAFARRLGFRSNVAHSWETGRNYPTASQTLGVAQRLGHDVRGALERFYRNPPEWLAGIEPASPEGVLHLLRDLRGRTSLAHLARTSGLSRFALSRVFSGKSEPRLPDFLRIVEASSLRVLDLIQVLVDPTELPSIADAFRMLEAARSVAYDEPWTLAVIRVLELEAYRASRQSSITFIATRLQLQRPVVERCLLLLERSGQIRAEGRRHRVVAGSALDTRHDPARARMLRKWWVERALERFGEGDDRIFSYSVFGVSERDYQRLRELHRAYFRELRAIVAASEPVERVVLANIQLLGLDTQTLRASGRARSPA
jgi:DNA-binding phage protein